MYLESVHIAVGLGTTAVRDLKYRAEEQAGHSKTPSNSHFDCKQNGVASLHRKSNDKVERRAVAPTTNETDLSQSSTPSLA